MAAGVLTPASGPSDTAFMPQPRVVPDAPVLLATTAEGRCVFHDHGARRCRIQQTLGHEMLPLACRQFPRVTVEDPRGISVTLSHYCPTAAAMLDSDAPAAIVADAPSFPADAEYIGLDARMSLPPRLRPDMLMDWESWWDWERLSVEHLGNAARADEALGRLVVAVADISHWRPADGPLRDRVRAAFRTADEGTAAPVAPGVGIDDVMVAIPAEVRPQARPLAQPTTGRALARFLAAHAFANWTAHYGTGLRAWMRSLEAAYTLATRFGAGQADLWLRHLADPVSLADKYSDAVEK